MAVRLRRGHFNPPHPFSAQVRFPPRSFLDISIDHSFGSQYWLKNELDHSFGSQYFAPQRHEGSGGRMRRALRAAPSCFGSRYFGAQPRRRRGPGARGGCSFLSLLILFSLSSPLFFPLFSLFSPLFSPSFPPSSPPKKMAGPDNRKEMSLGRRFAALFNTFIIIYG